MAHWWSYNFILIRSIVLIFFENIANLIFFTFCLKLPNHAHFFGCFMAGFRCMGYQTVASINFLISILILINDVVNFFANFLCSAPRFRRKEVYYSHDWLHDILNTAVWLIYYWRQNHVIKTSLLVQQIWQESPDGCQTVTRYDELTAARWPQMTSFRHMRASMVKV